MLQLTPDLKQVAKLIMVTCEFLKIIGSDEAFQLIVKLSGLQNLQLISETSEPKNPVTYP